MDGELQAGVTPAGLGGPRLSRRMVPCPANDLEKAGREKIPDYAFDSHTQKGRKMGKTKAEFFRDEQAALEPFQPGLFDDLIDG